MPMIELSGVHKSFGETHVLRGIDLAVGEHQVVCLIGSSGCGKSTLLRTINLLEPIDAGTITLTGETISDPAVDANAVRRRMGIVFQSYNLFPHLRAIDNVTLGLRRALGMSKADANAKAIPLLEQLGLGDHMQSYPNNLSGGQQQRVAICRALAGARAGEAGRAFRQPRAPTDQRVPSADNRSGSAVAGHFQSLIVWTPTADW